MNLQKFCCPNVVQIPPILHLKPPIIYIYHFISIGDFPAAMLPERPMANHRPGDTATAILLPKVVDAVRGKMSPLTGRPVQVVGSLGDAEMESWIHRKSRVNWEVDMGNHWQVE
jgi:hypothetical protein